MVSTSIERSSLRAALAFLLLMGLAPLAHAQTGEDKETADFAMTGTVEAVDAAKGTITLKGAEGEGGTLAVDPKAELKNDAATIALGDVKAGWQVTVNGDLRDGKKVVTYLEVVDTP